MFSFFDLIYLLKTLLLVFFFCLAAQAPWQGTQRPPGTILLPFRGAYSSSYAKLRYVKIPCPRCCCREQHCCLRDSFAHALLVGCLLSRFIRIALSSDMLLTLYARIILSDPCRRCWRTMKRPLGTPSARLRSSPHSTEVLCATALSAGTRHVS